MKRPNGKELGAKILDIEQDITSKYNEIKKLNKQLREINQSIEQKNSGFKKEISKHNAVKRDLFDKAKEIKTEKE